MGKITLTLFYYLPILACFGPWDLGPQHGFARTSRWTLASKDDKVRTVDTVRFFLSYPFGFGR